MTAYNNITLKEVIEIYKNSNVKMFASTFSNTMHNVLNKMNSMNNLKPEDAYFFIPTYITLTQILEVDSNLSLNEKSSDFLEDFEQTLADSEGIGMESSSNDIIFYFDYVNEGYNSVLEQYNLLTAGKLDYLKSKVNETIVKNASNKERSTSVYFDGLIGRLPKVTGLELEQLADYYKVKGFDVTYSFDKDKSHLNIQFQVE
jgi:hypothetical protein